MYHVAFYHGLSVFFSMNYKKQNKQPLNMKKLLYAVPLLLLAACSDNSDVEVTDPITPGQGEKLYITLEAKLFDQAQTKSTTNSDGTSSDRNQTATTAESELKTIDIYLWDGTNTPVQLRYDSRDGSNPYTIKAEITYEDLRTFAASKPQLLVVGNGGASDGPFTSAVSVTAPMTQTFSVTDFNTTPTGDYGTAGKTMPFVNYNKFEVDFSSLTDPNTNENDFVKSIETLFGSNHTYDVSASGTKTLDLERAVARVDYGETRTSKTEADNVFELGDVYSHYLKLYSIQLYNVSKEAYLFRHTLQGTYESAYGTPANSVTLFDPENNSSDNSSYTWVVDTDWSNSSTPTKGTNFLNPYSSLETSTDGLILLSDLMTTTNPREKADGYYPWRYIMENTIPTGALMATPDTYATSVKFVFQVCKDAQGAQPETGTSGSKLTLTMPGDHKSQPYYYQDIDYDATKGGYFLTYYGTIHHNEGDDVTVSGDDPDPATVPAPMKYAIVRNNVYQLSVKSVKNLPNPEEPETMYLQLSVKVLPWVKRKNDFYF